MATPFVGLLQSRHPARDSFNLSDPASGLEVSGLSPPGLQLFPSQRCGGRDAPGRASRSPAKHSDKAEGVSGLASWTRQSNERIAVQARAQKFVSPVPMLCECEEGCASLILLSLDEYSAICDSGRLVLAPGHASPVRDEQPRSAS
jgi:hypothetical protein